uniref:Uncharacterized protein n=1 Tax=Nelumbo nucifera TaxID=4432 RepID=A0A822XXS2_NELNU|nr:TPA_asm: hypothetical protein HUJ06_023651 [Nelumbo nucifera]
MGPKPTEQPFGLSSHHRLSKMQLDCGDAIGYALTAPTGHMDLSLWERVYLIGIENLKLTELDYWPPKDRDVNQRSFSFSPYLSFFLPALSLSPPLLLLSRATSPLLISLTLSLLAISLSFSLSLLFHHPAASCRDGSGILLSPFVSLSLILSISLSLHSQPLISLPSAPLFSFEEAHRRRQSEKGVPLVSHCVQLRLHLRLCLSLVSLSILNLLSLSSLRPSDFIQRGLINAAGARRGFRHRCCIF